MLDKHEDLLDEESNLGGGNSNADNEEQDDAGGSCQAELPP